MLSLRLLTVCLDWKFCLETSKSFLLEYFLEKVTDDQLGILLKEWTRRRWKSLSLESVRRTIILSRMEELNWTKLWFRLKIHS